MNIQLVDDQNLIARLGQSSSVGIRTLGVVHLSDIYGSLMKRLQPDRFNQPMDTIAFTRMETGIAFENMLERGLAEKYATVRPGEIISTEGVYMSPDGINPTLDAGEEYKCTWMSSRSKGSTPYTDEEGKPSEKFIHWFFQMMGYAKWLGTERFLLRVLHVNGDYTYPLTPLFITHLIEFTESEIDENWSMLMNHARSEGIL